MADGDRNVANANYQCIHCGTPVPELYKDFKNGIFKLYYCVGFVFCTFDICTFFLVICGYRCFLLCIYNVYFHNYRSISVVVCTTSFGYFTED